MMKILVVVFAVVILSTQAEEDLGEDDENHWGEDDEKQADWGKDEEAEHELEDDADEHESDDHKSDTNDWHKEMYGSGSFDTIFLPLLVASVVLARLARR